MVLLKTEHKNPYMLYRLIEVAPEALLIPDNDNKYPYQVLSPVDHKYHYELVTMATALFAMEVGKVDVSLEALKQMQQNGFSEAIFLTFNELLERFRKQFVISFPK